jgi:hypothetical protein
MNDYDDWGGYDGGPDVTDNPALDVDGYQSPRRTGNLTRFKSSQIDWLAQAKADRATPRLRCLAPRS